MIERRLEVKIIRSNLDNLWGVLRSKASRRITRGKGHPPQKNSSRNLNLKAAKMFLFQTQTYLEISKELSRKEQKNPGANQQVQERFCNLCKVQRIFEATLPTVMLSKMLGGCFWSKASLSLRNVTRRMLKFTQPYPLERLPLMWSFRTRTYGTHIDKSLASHVRQSIPIPEVCGLSGVFLSTWMLRSWSVFCNFTVVKLLCSGNGHNPQSPLTSWL